MPNGFEQSAPVFDRARRLAKTLFGDTVEASVVLVGEGDAWRSHDPSGQAPKDAPVARIAVEENRLIWIADATQDPRFCDRPSVVGPPYVRFYVAAPIRLEDGSIPGVFAASGPMTRIFDEDLGARMQDLADFVADEWSRIQAKLARESARRDSDVAKRMVAQIIQTAPLSLLMTDLGMAVLSASPRWIEARQLTGQEIVGRSLYDIFPDTHEKWRPGV